MDALGTFRVKPGFVIAFRPMLGLFFLVSRFGGDPPKDANQPNREIGGEMLLR